MSVASPRKSTPNESPRRIWPKKKQSVRVHSDASVIILGRTTELPGGGRTDSHLSGASAKNARASPSAAMCSVSFFKLSIWICAAMGDCQISLSTRARDLSKPGRFTLKDLDILPACQSMARTNRWTPGRVCQPPPPTGFDSRISKSIQPFRYPKSVTRFRSRSASLAQEPNRLRSQAILVLSHPC
jgi:hypothetical protein